MEFNIESINELKEGKTYLITFPADAPLEIVEKTVNNINNYVREHNRNIVFIYTVKDIITIEESN